ncbi:hypothetical protein MSG28_006998 [Choristoneura fumiferana]|uniref:Uncharacterized protein n=1 Tax=Choristoneura fumiferana TaxID=7141 RepID=A0ACC0JM52_CHOFU|nr:hypothetical protein MSG28_006998 [Choristoneura fumiferana]
MYGTPYIGRSSNPPPIDLWKFSKHWQHRRQVDIEKEEEYDYDALINEYYAEAIREEMSNETYHVVKIGWCCCCLYCKCFKAHETINNARIYLRLNPPGVLRDKSGDIVYEPSDKEKETYEEPFIKVVIMRLISRCIYLKQVSTLYCKSNSNRRRECNVFIRQYSSIFARSPLKLLPVGCAYYSDEKKHFLNLDKKAEVFKDVFKHKKEQLKDTEHRIRQRGEELVRDIKQQRELTGQRLREKSEHLVKDILETKAKVKERIEEVVERDRVYTIPNFLCVTRIAMSPYLGYVILQDNYNLALDGWIARTWVSQSSRMGSFLDPLADKVLIATLFVTLTWQTLIPLWLTVLIVARDAALVAAGFVIRYMSLPPPRTLSRYFDVTRATAQLAPTFISKVGTTLASPVFGFVDHAALHALWAVTAASTVVSAASYLVSKDTYKILKKNK